MAISPLSWIKPAIIAASFSVAGCQQSFVQQPPYCEILGQCQSVDTDIVYGKQTKAAPKEKNIIVSSLEDRISFYEQNETPEVTFEGHREITLNNSYERKKKEEVQKILGKAGLLAEREAVGCFDKVTVDALKKFQKKNKSLQDGKVGPSTADALNKVAKFELDTDNYELLPDTACILNVEDNRLIEEIQAALNFHNYLAKEPDGKLDDETVGAIRAYKRYNTINNRDSIDKALLRHLSASSSQRAGLLKEALEAFQSIKPSFSNNIYANIPEFRMRYFKGNRQVISLDVIAGQHDREDKWPTDVQQGAIRYATINPWWRVPAGDLTKEVRRDMNNSISLRSVMEQLVEGDWKIIKSGAYGTRFRQRPGPSNPLGRVAYNFEGGTGEMLHGTPKHKLFKNNIRSFSHGCMRLSSEIELFRKFQELGLINKDINLDGLIAQTDEEGIYKSKDVRLKEPVKVNVVYLRAFAEEGQYGIFMTMPSDIYDYKKSKAK